MKRQVVCQAERIPFIMRIKHSEQHNVFSIIEKLILFPLLLSFVGFYNYSIPLILVAFLLLCLLKTRLHITVGVIPPILLTVGMFLNSSGGDLSVAAINLVWPAAYWLGFEMMRESQSSYPDWEKREKKLEFCVQIAAIGFFVHLVLNLVTNRHNSDMGRNTLDFWTQNATAATGQAGLACVPMGWCVASLFKDRKLISKLPILTGMTIMLYYNLTLASRTMVYSVLILLVVSLSCLMEQNRSATQKVRVIGSLTIIVILITVIYIFNMWGVRTLIEESVLMERLMGDNQLSISEDSRWTRKLQYLQLMPHYSAGNREIRKVVGGYAHDILLDTYDTNGILAFVAIIAILWDSIAKLIRFFKLQTVSSNTKRMILNIYVACVITFSVEPILEGLPWLLATYCFLHGMVTSFTKHTAYKRQIVQSTNEKEH